ncbi:MAG: NifB/NifX family molybdenum-iron cluster-binding protein [Campylobacterota bacterium]|nr:NifB/NifX family molybdenum-iron cluster-binding protein [Campylobacterota bacterium]
MKIVVAVDSDKQTIIKRTGQAIYFAIYEDDKVIDYISNSQDEKEHHDMTQTQHTNAHKKNITKLQGCDIILAQAVGENMKAALDSIGLKIKKVRKKDGLTADEVVKNFLNNNI